jgi:nitrile hydratase
VKAAYSAGQRVRVDDRDPPGHIRTPWYIRGKRGVVTEICGAHANPEELAQGRLGVPYRMLYRVSFAQAEVWPHYSGPAHDRVFVDLYEHWLKESE